MRLLESPELARRPLTLEVVTSLADLQRLHAEWHALWQRCAATPFQSPDWLIPWWRHLGRGALHVPRVRADDRLVGLAPFAIVQTAESNLVLQFLGTGVSDYGDVLLEPDFETAAATLIWSTIAEASASNKIDRIDLQQLAAESVLLRTAARESIDVASNEPCPVLTLRGRRDAWLPAGWRHKLDYDRRRLQRCAAMEFIRADRGNFDELRTELMRLHAMRRAESGGGAFADASVRAFHAEAATAMLANDTLRLYALRADDAIVAAYYGFVVRGRACYYIGGFDPAWEKFGVGNLLVEHAMLEAAHEGAAAFDFLRGREPYKYRWGARDEPTFRLSQRKSGSLPRG
jgi:CelD/BcsL family acetyltransferase involved in cellulose biosynthesis